MPDFQRQDIEVRYASDSYGPHKFDMTDAIPSGTTLDSVTVRSFLGKVDKEDDLSAETETTSELIDAVASMVVSNTEIEVYFEYPSTAAWKSGGKKHTVVLEVTFANGGVHPYFFHYVKVY